MLCSGKKLAEIKLKVLDSTHSTWASYKAYAMLYIFVHFQRDRKPKV
jgi:hypothetical protein